ncbi:MAG: MerR family transcriptional regulator [Clostridia bacterium]|nr:MerR family transcriptional regulator [Clostridia bacterium]
MYYSISEAAKKTNLTAFTLRYYDKEGLLSPGRTEKGIRYFTDADLSRIETVRCLKNTGMTIREIQHFFDLCSLGEESLSDQLELFLQHRAKILNELQVLQQHLQQVDEQITWFHTALAAKSIR